MLEKNSCKALSQKTENDDYSSWFTNDGEQPWIFRHPEKCLHSPICMFTGFYDCTTFEELTPKQREYCRQFHNVFNITEKNFKGIPIFEHDIVWFEKVCPDSEQKLHFGYVAYVDNCFKIISADENTAYDLFETLLHTSKNSKVLCTGNIHIKNDVSATEEYFGIIWPEITYKRKILLTVYVNAQLSNSKSSENIDTGDMAIYKWSKYNKNQAVLFTHKTIITEDEAFAANELMKHLNFGDFDNPRITSWNHTETGESDSIRPDYIFTKSSGLFAQKLKGRPE